MTLIDARQAAELLGVSLSTFTHKLSYAPGFPVCIQYTPRGRRLWKRDEVLDFIDRKQQQGIRAAA